MIENNKITYYTQQQNEEFYYTAAMKFLKYNSNVQHGDIFDGSVLNKQNFFKLYFNKYHWSKGVWSDKNLAKRMYDGIQRYFTAYFEQMIKIFVNKNIPQDDILRKIMKEAATVISDTRLQYLQPKWAELCHQLNQQKNYINVIQKNCKNQIIKHFNPNLLSQFNSPEHTTINQTTAEQLDTIEPLTVQHAGNAIQSDSLSGDDSIDFKNEQILQVLNSLLTLQIGVQ